MASQVLVTTLEQELPTVVVFSTFTVAPLHASVASHVRVSTDVHPVVVVVVPRVFTVAPLQASLAVGSVNDGVAVHSIVALPPAWPIVGGVVSTTVITCVLVAE